MKRHKPDVSRREFIGSVTAAGAAAVVAGSGTRLGRKHRRRERRPARHAPRTERSSELD